MTESEILKPGMDIRPKLTSKEGILLVKKLYGFECLSIIELNGYDDRNFKIIVTNNFKNEFVDNVSEDGYVLKILNSLDSKKLDFVDAQNQLLIFLGNNDIICPIPVPTTSGNYFSLENLSSGIHIVRLMKYIPGTILLNVPLSSNLFYEIGIYIATLDKILQNFEHPIYETHKTLWMLDSVPELRKFSFAITNDDSTSMVQHIIQEFEERVLSNISKLEKGMIHGDFNEQNILVENVMGPWRVKAILDFGDTQFSCYLFELAVALTYGMIFAKNLDIGGYVIAGYTTVRKIPENEFLLLKICIEARLCQSLVMGAYSSMRDPNNSYVLSTYKLGWELLEKLRSKSDEEVLNLWKAVSTEYIS